MCGVSHVQRASSAAAGPTDLKAVLITRKVVGPMRGVAVFAAAAVSLVAVALWYYYSTRKESKDDKKRPAEGGKDGELRPRQRRAFHALRDGLQHATLKNL